ncbi:hypothetical protein Bbelb_001990 [Branchiostoma belcheri]|nr:hypothetical protein Bbelb_001990 [Branchiostoma belcheri]
MVTDGLGQLTSAKHDHNPLSLRLKSGQRSTFEAVPRQLIAVHVGTGLKNGVPKHRGNCIDFRVRLEASYSGVESPGVRSNLVGSLRNHRGRLRDAPDSFVEGIDQYLHFRATG